MSQTRKDKAAIDCISFGYTKGGRPQCKALKDVFCITEPDKPCSFMKATAGQQGGKGRETNEGTDDRRAQSMCGR